MNCASKIYKAYQITHCLNCVVKCELHLFMKEKMTKLFRKREQYGIKIVRSERIMYVHRKLKEYDVTDKRKKWKKWWQKEIGV